jgi:hypothetical protein
MSFNKLYLDKEKFIEMFKSGTLDLLLRTDAIIFLDNKSTKYFKLLKNNEMDKLKKIMSKYGS